MRFSMTPGRKMRKLGCFPAARPGAREIFQLTAMRSRKYGALEQYFVALARGCSARGWRLVVQYNEPPRSSRYVGDLQDAGATVIVKRLGAGRLSAACRALVLVAQRRPAIVHLHFCNGLTRLAVGLLAHRLGVGLTVATVHSMPNVGSRAFARASYGRIDRILCVSRSVERALVRMGVSSSRLTTHYLGVPDLGPLPTEARDVARQRLGIPATSPVLVTVVFNNPMKGIDVIVDAFVDYLSTAFPNVHLIVVGVPPDERVRASRRPDCSSGRLHWEGIKDDVRPLLAASDIYVQPSRTEGLGLAIVEAMRESLPVVATRVGGIPEVVADGESGLLVEPDSPRQLAAAISRLLTDGELARRFARVGHARWRQHFELQRSVDTLLESGYGSAEPRRSLAEGRMSPRL